MRTKARTVVSAEADEIAAVERLVRAGKYETVSDFVRQAMSEKLRREHDAALADEVERYVRARSGERSEDDALVRAQALPASRVTRRRRAKR